MFSDSFTVFHYIVQVQASGLNSRKTKTLQITLQDKGCFWYWPEYAVILDCSLEHPALLFNKASLHFFPEVIFATQQSDVFPWHIYVAEAGAGVGPVFLFAWCKSTQVHIFQEFVSLWRSGGVGQAAVFMGHAGGKCHGTLVLRSSISPDISSSSALLRVYGFVPPLRLSQRK